jgi:hypothetical protein
MLVYLKGLHQKIPGVELFSAEEGDKAGITSGPQGAE